MTIIGHNDRYWSQQLVLVTMTGIGHIHWMMTGIGHPHPVDVTNTGHPKLFDWCAVCRLDRQVCSTGVLVGQTGLLNRFAGWTDRSVQPVCWLDR
jgi:hypothetical protein